MAKIPYPEVNDIPASVRALLDARPPRNVFRMLAHATSLMPGIMELTGAILYRAKLDPVSRELLILRVGHLCGSSYEVQQHRKIARAVGLSQEKIDGTAAEADAGIYSERELAILRLTEQVVRQVKADDAVLASVEAAFGHEQLVEILVIIGTYIMLAAVLENTGVELEEGGGPAQQDVETIFRSQSR